MSVHHSLRCMKCYKEYERKWIGSAGKSRGGSRDSYWIKWRNVEVVASTKNGTPICKCNNCGHQYKSNSMCALRAYKWSVESGKIKAASDG